MRKFFEELIEPALPLAAGPPVCQHGLLPGHLLDLARRETRVDVRIDPVVLIERELSLANRTRPLRLLRRSNLNKRGVVLIPCYLWYIEHRLFVVSYAATGDSMRE